MNGLKKITWAALTLFIIGSASNNAIGELGGDKEKTETLVIGTVAFAALLVYDIATAPSSATRYNEGLIGMYPLIENRKYVESTVKTFGQARFSRSALIKDFLQPIFYHSNQLKKKEKSPTTALYWSLAATVIPTAIGISFLTSESEQHSIGVSGVLLTTAGALIGPSAGHFYSKRVGRGLLTVVLRIGFAALALYSIDYSSGGDG